MTSDSDFDKIFNTLPSGRGEREPLRPRSSLRQDRKPAGNWGKRIFAAVAISVLVISGTGLWLLWDEYGTRIVEYFQEEEVPNFEVAELSQSSRLSLTLVT